MEMNQTSNRIHPLVAGAAASVMLVSLVGVAAITGLFPSSHSTAPDSLHAANQPSAAIVASPMPSISAAPMQQVAQSATPTQQYALVPVQSSQQQAAPVVVREVIEHKTIVHDKYVQRAAMPHRQHQAQYAQYDSAPRYAPAPVYQQASASSSNSPIGMGIGAVVGGLVGSQVGGGNGKTLATIAGAVGGGYLGNEVAKRYP
jgi:uncharacterized protein YcfJ